MKTQNSIYKSLKKPFAGVIILLLSVVMMAPSCREQRYYEDEVYPDGNYVDDGAVYSSVPDWAPAYSNPAVVRYYYFPDYYMYYDVWSANYVYWDGFGWVYATTYPGYIGYFNPYGAYVVVLGHNVYRPWGNHYYYVDQYPQYYYQNNYYGHRDNSIVRGYDENGGGAVYVPRDSRQGKDMLNSPANRKDINNLKQPPREGSKGSPADQKGTPSNRQQQNTIDKNDRQAPFDKGQDRQQPGPVKRDQPGDNRNAPDMKNNMQPQKGFDQQQPQKNMERQPGNNMERQQQKNMERQQQKNFNDQRNFDRPQQQQAPPANLQRPQQQGGQPPMQRSSPPQGGGTEKRGGGGGRR